MQKSKGRASRANADVNSGPGRLAVPVIRYKKGFPQEAL